MEQGRGYEAIHSTIFSISAPSKTQLIRGYLNLNINGTI